MSHSGREKVVSAKRALPNAQNWASKKTGLAGTPPHPPPFQGHPSRTARGFSCVQVFPESALPREESWSSLAQLGCPLWAGPGLPPSENTCLLWGFPGESHSVESNSLWPYWYTVHGILQARIVEWIAIPFSKGIFPNQGSKPGLPHCRRILYQLSHQGSLRILEWVAYLFSRGSSRPRNWTEVSCIAGGFFTNWVTRETPQFMSTLF